MISSGTATPGHSNTFSCFCFPNSAGGFPRNCWRVCSSLPAPSTAHRTCRYPSSDPRFAEPRQSHRQTLSSVRLASWDTHGKLHNSATSPAGIRQQNPPCNTILTRSRESAAHATMGTITNKSECMRLELIDCAERIWSCDTLEKATSLIRSRSRPLILQNYVSGELGLPASISTEYIEVFEPKTGALFAKLPCTQSDDVQDVIGHARIAFQTWSKTTRAERSCYLRRISELLQKHGELFAVWESIDQGKTLERARIEVDRAISNFSWVIRSRDPLTAI